MSLVLYVIVYLFLSIFFVVPIPLGSFFSLIFLVFSLAYIGANQMAFSWSLDSTDA
jgi:hypothetical protein